MDTNSDYAQVVRLSFNQEFQNMIQVCIFVPFLHQETPKPVNVTKVPCSRESDQVIMNQIAQVLELRNKISEMQRKK